MKFTELTIKNFRGIREAKVESIKQINLFLGKNNACKTSLLETIFTITGMSNPLISSQINAFRGLDFEDKDGFRFLFHNLDYKNAPCITATFDKNETKRKLTIIPEKKREISHSVKPKSIEKLDSTITNSNQLTNTINGLNFNFSFKEKNSEEIKGLSKIRIEDTKVDIEEAKEYDEKLLATFLSDTNTKKIERVLAASLEKIIVQKGQNEIIDILKEIDRLITGISLGNNSKVYLDIGIERLVPLNVMGDGIKKILFLITTIYNKSNGVILIDEIGNGLHYSAIKTLWRAILKATKRYDAQIFITTHNREILKYLKEVLEEETFWDYRDDVMVFTLRKLKNNCLKAYNYNFDDFHHAIEQDNEIR